MRHLWRSASWGSLRGHVCAVRAVSSIEGNRAMGQHLRKISAFAIAAATTNSSRRNMQNQTIGQVQPIVHAPQPAMDGMATGQRPRRASISGNCQRGRSLRRAAGSGWLHDLDSRRAALPTGINEGIARPRGAPARSSADGDRHQRGFENRAGSGRCPFQAALFKPPWPWPWPRGSRSHPSRPATGNHRVRARVPSAEP